MTQRRRGLMWMGLCIVMGMGWSGCGGKQAEIKDDRLTVGRVQGEVKVGMSAAQVAELLGSPNIVTTDDKRREVWIYDKVSTDRVDTASSSYAGLIILGTNTSDRFKYWPYSRALRSFAARRKPTSRTLSSI